MQFTRTIAATALASLLCAGSAGAQETLHCSKTVGALGVADESSEGHFVRGALPPVNLVATASPGIPDPAEVPFEPTDGSYSMISLNRSSPAGAYVVRYPVALPAHATATGNLDAAYYFQDDDEFVDRVIVKLFRFSEGGRVTFVTSLGSTRAPVPEEGKFIWQVEEFQISEDGEPDEIGGYFIEAMLITDRSAEMTAPVTDEIRGPALLRVGVCIEAAE